MHSLKAITPLGADQPQIDTFADLVISEMPGRALASLTARLGREAACRETAAGFLGFVLPEAGQSEAAESFSAFWIGPDSWMIDADHDRHEGLAADVKAAVRDNASVVEQTDAWCRFGVAGGSVSDLFERLCNADIRAMETGAVTRCSIHHISCYLWYHKAGADFSVLGPRSSAGSLHHALTEIARTISA